jgi:hypothetical protein
MPLISDSTTAGRSRTESEGDIAPFPHDRHFESSWINGVLRVKRGKPQGRPFSIRRFVRVLKGLGPDNFRQSEIRFLGSESPLEIAAMREHMKVVRFLLGKGASRVNPGLDYHPAIRQILCSALSEFHALL